MRDQVKVIASGKIVTFEDIYEFIEPKILVDGGQVPEIWTREWAAASSDSFRVSA